MLKKLLLTFSVVMVLTVATVVPSFAEDPPCDGSESAISDVSGGGDFMSNILSTVTTFIVGSGSGSSHVDGVIDWAADFLSLLTSNGVLTLFCIALPLVGLGIGVIRRLVRIRA